MENNWIQDWTEPPSSTETLQLWTIYCVLWKECELPAAGYWVQRWLKLKGNPTRENDLNGFYQLALNRYLYPAAERRAA